MSTPASGDAFSGGLLDLNGGYAPSIGFRGDLQARIRDFLARKNLALGAKLESVLKAAESTLTREKLHATLLALRGRFRKAPSAGAPAATVEWQLLVERIHRAGREGTIECYSSYLLTLDTDI